MTNTYAIGDIHGCLRHLEQLVTLCEDDAAEQPMQLVFLGDYIDRGPDSHGVVEYLIELQAFMPDRVICLMGNHEDMLLKAFEDEGREDHWLRNGGTQTLYSYQVPSAVDLPRRHVEWFRSLPTSHDDGMRFFVHAGVHPERPLDQQDEQDLLWIREPFLSSQKDFGRLVVHGHTPLASGIPDQRPNRLNIDTGAVFGRALTAAVFTEHLPSAARFLTASHLQRPDIS